MKLAVNAIRFLALEMINKADSGHPGIAIDFAPTFYVLFTRHLNISRQHPTWINRDRIILEAGHGSALLYATLYLTNSGLTVKDLKSFRQINSQTPGHPEINPNLGIETTTGPLGQGMAQGVGMAIAESVLATKFNSPRCQLINHFTYVVCSDGGLQEGISYEATNLAGVLNLNKLIVLYDSNQIQLDGPTNQTWIENINQRFQAINWHYQVVTDGNDIEAIDQAIINAKASHQPSIIEIKTVIGEGSDKQGTAQVHGQSLKKDDLERIKKYYDYHYPPFQVDPKVFNHFYNTVVRRGERAYQTWHDSNWNQFQKQPQKLKIFQQGVKRKWTTSKLKIKESELLQKEATRVSSGRILKQICDQIPTWIGGSADLASSCKTPMKKIIEGGSAIWYGVREHAMVAISSGVSLHGGLFPFCSTFLVFSDYARAAIRLAAMMKTPMLLIFTHDSVLVGPDGPTHQPIEQLIGLRLIPNLLVLRPADQTEVWGCYQLVLNQPVTPYALILTRQPTTQIKTTNWLAVRKGGYVVYKCAVKNHQIIILASGSELSLAIKVAQKIKNNYQLTTKVISLVCWKLLESQSQNYQNQLFENNQNFRVSLELGTTYGWSKWAHLNIGINHFGFSGSKDQIKAILNLNSTAVAQKILKQWQKYNERSKNNN